MDRAAAWEGFASVRSASKGCWDRGPDEVVEARLFVGPQGDVRSAGASRGGDVAECMLPILRATRFPPAKESSSITARLIRVP